VHLPFSYGPIRPIQAASPWRRLFVVAALLAGLASAPALGKTAVVLNSDDDSLSVIDTETYKETARTHIGRQPHHLIMSPDGQNLIIAMAEGNELVFIDRPTGEIKQHVEASDPYQVGFSPDAKWFVTTSLRLASTSTTPPITRSSSAWRRRRCRAISAFPRTAARSTSRCRAATG
jgi:YVTN family beta-propeller protein